MRWLLAVLLMCFFVGTSDAQFSRVLMTGNSLLYHPPAPSIEWPGDWGMAASAREKDYAHRLGSLLDSLQTGTAVVSILSHGGFESRYDSMDINQFVAPTAGLDAQLIAIQLSEIVDPATAIQRNFGSYYRTLIQTFKAVHPKAKFVCMTRFWLNSLVDSIITSAGNSEGAAIANLGVIGSDILNQARSESTYSFPGVGFHPGDRGMDRIARAILAASMTVDVQEVPLIPGGIALLRCYPNPFNPTTNIEFEMPGAGPARVTIFDVLGREIGILFDSHAGSGRNRIFFDASFLSSGMYICRLQAGTRMVSLKLVLAR